MYNYFSSDTTGPDLSIPLWGHSMVPLSNGQAILGGNYFNKGTNQQVEWNPNIYFLTCSNLECNIQTMTQTASFLATYFVAIPIPDDMSGCMFRGKLIELTIKAVFFLKKHKKNPEISIIIQILELTKFNYSRNCTIVQFLGPQNPTLGVQEVALLKLCYLYTRC